MLRNTHYSLALVRKNADGTASIVFGTNNSGAVNTVLGIAGKALKLRRMQIDEENIPSQHAAQRTANLKSLCAQFTDTLAKKAPVLQPHANQAAELVPA